MSDRAVPQLELGGVRETDDDPRAAHTTTTTRRSIDRSIDLGDALERLAERLERLVERLAQPPLALLLVELVRVVDRALGAVERFGRVDHLCAAAADGRTRADVRVGGGAIGCVR